MKTMLSKDARRDMLNRGFVMLETLRYCREKCGLQSLGREAEKSLLDTVLRDLAHCTALHEIDEELAKKKK